MASFLKELGFFRGTGAVNEDGLTLEEFLETYDADKYKKPSVTADVLVFGYQKEQQNLLDGIKLLMVKRRNHPSIGFWAIPGGFANMREDLVDTARRELEEETGLTNIPLVQMYTYGEYKRDPRDRVVTTAYLALIEDGTQKAQAGDDAADAKWWNVDVTLQDTREDGEVIYKEYHLSMQTEGEEELTAAVVERIHGKWLLKESDFVVKENKGIAFDHARYIVQAYVYLEKRLNKSN